MGIGDGYRKEGGVEENRKVEQARIEKPRGRKW
jgi:hypothetical protein